MSRRPTLMQCLALRTADRNAARPLCATQFHTIPLDQRPLRECLGAAQWHVMRVMHVMLRRCMT